MGMSRFQERKNPSFSAAMPSRLLGGHVPRTTEEAKLRLKIELDLNCSRIESAGIHQTYATLGLILFETIRHPHFRPLMHRPDSCGFAARAQRAATQPPSRKAMQ